MNVVVSNRQKDIIDNANIDAIKDLNGLFSVNDLVGKFKNYFFSKMILDATSIVDFATRDVLQKLVDEIGSDRLIILLPSTPEPPDDFKKLLIELRIYNFSNNIDDVVKFIETPNTYENAMKTIKDSYANNGDYYVDSSIKDGEDIDLEPDITDNVENNDTNNSFENISITDDNSTIETDTIKENSDVVKNSNYASLGDMMNSFNVYSDNTVETTSMPETIESNEIMESDKEKELSDVKTDDVDNSEEHNEVSDSINNSHVFLNLNGFDEYDDIPSEKKVIGFRNVTEHAGSTTLIYLLEKEGLKRKKDIVSIEINKNDFKLFRNSKMVSIKEEDLVSTLGSLREDIVLIDLNNYQDNSLCNEVIYLIEPSTIKLNKLMMINSSIFNDLKDKKIVLNQSMLSNSDIPILEKEAGVKFFFSIGSINDRIDNSIIGELFDKVLNN